MSQSPLAPASPASAASAASAGSLTSLVATTLPVLPGTVSANGQPATLGIMGGGQLGRMFVHAAQRLGYFTAVLDPDPQSPAGRVSHHHIQTDYADAAGLTRLAALSAAITTEFENVPAEALRSLAAQLPVAPAAACVAVAQDRVAEKNHLSACAAVSGVPCAPYAVIDSEAALHQVADDLLPGILKTARMGYDGKGQVRVTTRTELAAAWQSLQGVVCVLEKMLPLHAECSVIVARGHDGCIVSYAPQRNVHVDGILAVTHAGENALPDALAKAALDAAQSIARYLDYVGVLCVEFFVITGHDGADTLVVNEIAPRPHNSGHYTLDACDLSQFDLQVRAVAGLPLPMPRQHSPAIMLNLLGEVWFNAQGHERTPDWPAVLALTGAHLHLYGKLQARPGRKMGHLTFTGSDSAQVRANAQRAAELLGLPGRDSI